MNSPSVTKIVPALSFLFILFFPLKDTIYDLSTLLLDAVFIYVIFGTSGYRSFKAYHNLLFSFLLIFISMTISNAFGIGGMEGWRYQAVYVSHFVVFLLAVIYFLNTSCLLFRSLVLFLLISFVIHSLDGAFQYFHGIDLIKDNPLFEQRITGAVYSPNHFGLILMVAAQVAFFVITSARDQRLSMLSVCGLVTLLALALFGLLYSGSRAAWVGLFAGMVMFLALEWRRIPVKVLLAIALIVIAILGVCFLDPLLHERIGTVSPGSSSSIRITTWSFIVEKIFQQPLIGYGIGSLPVLARGMPPEVVHSAHNIFLEIWLYLGASGCAAFLFFFYAIGKRLAEIRASHEKFVQTTTILSSLTVNSLFGNSLITDRIFLSIFAILLAVLFSDTKKAAPVV